MLEKIRTIIADQLSVEESSIQPETSLTKDLEADSLDFVELIMALEDTFDVMFESDDILYFGGYMNGMEILKRYGVDFDE